LRLLREAARYRTDTPCSEVYGSGVASPMLFHTTTTSRRDGILVDKMAVKVALSSSGL
jgi:hypothetical protein